MKSSGGKYNKLKNGRHNQINSSIDEEEEEDTRSTSSNDSSNTDTNSSYSGYGVVGRSGLSNRNGINNNNNNNNEEYASMIKRGKKRGKLGTMERFKIGFRSWVHFMKHIIVHTVNNNLRNKLSYFLGFSACFLVVFVVSLCVSIISNTPVVFLNLSEVSVGEMDMVVSSTSILGALNYSLASSLLQGDSDDSYHAPRISGPQITLVSGKTCGDTDPSHTSWKYGVNSDGSRMDCFPNCFLDACANGTSSFADLLVIDSALEERMGLGRAWSLPAVPYGQAYVQSGLASTLGIQKGDTVYLELDVAYVMSNLFWNANISVFSLNGTYPTVILTVTVADTFTSNGGKFGKDEATAFIMEYNQLLSLILSQINPIFPPSSIAYLSQSNLYEYADNIIINLPPSRLQPYINSNQDTILNNLIKFSSKILYKVGFDELNSQLPVMRELSKNRYVALFLGLILNVIIFILLFLSILLIYSLLMIDVETRTFEMGVMRMIGTTRGGIIQLMLCKAFSYSLPSWACGLLLAQLFGLAVSAWFASITGVPIPPRLTPEGILLATLLGMIIPVAASIFPIKNALGRNLHDSLDVKHSKAMAVQISIERSEDNNFSTSVAVIGLILAAFGFGIYYIFPLSLLSFNLTLLLNMFFLLLIAMLLGLVLLALNVEHLLERLAVFVFLFWEKPAIPTIVLKNLVAHKLRNRKTAIMYAVSLAFIIFVNVSYSTQQASMNYRVLQQSGSYLRLNAGNYFNPNDAATLETLILGMGSRVASFAWISKSMSTLSSGSSWTASYVSNIGHIYSDVNVIYAVTPNYFETALPDFLKVASVADDPDYTLDHRSYMGLSEQLYSSHSSNGMIMGQVYSSMLGASVTTSLLLKTTFINSDLSTNTTGHLLEPVALLKSAPGFSFSEFPSVTSQDAIMSMPAMVAYAFNGGSPVDSVRSIPMSSLLIAASDSSAVSSIRADLNTFLSNWDRSTSLFDYDKEIEPNKTASNIIQYFFSFTTVIAMVISFFSLMSSMFTNIYEQTKEIGILRAIGIPKVWMIRIYIYESFVLVFSSSLLGVIIGALVGWTMILQRVLFTQLPIPFEFPWILLLVVFLCSVVFSFISAFGPIRKVLNQQVVNIMRIVT